MYVTLPAEPSSLTAARRVVRSVLRSWDCAAEQVDDAQLVATELAKNVIRHTAVPSYDLELQHSGRPLGAITVRVGASGTKPPGPVPAPRTPSGPPESLPDEGWGLPLIDAVAARWGTDSAGERHSTWAVLAAGASCPAPPPP